MNRLTRIASALFIALIFVVLAACTATDPRLEDESTIPAALAELAGPARAEPFVIVSGADVTLAADESVDLFFVYNGTARIEGHASSVVVVNGTANLVGGSAGNVIAIQSQVSVDPSSVVAGDIRTIESSVTGVSATTVTGAVRDIGLDMFVSWRNLGALALIYIAFAVSAVMAGLVLAGLAGRQVRAAGALIVKEPVMVIAAGVLGLAVLLMVGILADRHDRRHPVRGRPAGDRPPWALRHRLHRDRHLVGRADPRPVLAGPPRAALPRRGPRPDDRRADQLPSVDRRTDQLRRLRRRHAALVARPAGRSWSCSGGRGQCLGRPRSELIARRHPAERPSSNGGRRRVGRSGPCAGRPPGAGARTGSGSRIDG